LSLLRHQHALPRHNYRTVRGSPSPGFETSLWANKYAILSCRWFADEDEVSYDNMLSIDSSDKPGYAKIVGFCANWVKLSTTYTCGTAAAKYALRTVPSGCSRKEAWIKVKYIHSLHLRNHYLRQPLNNCK
jgi:hypothetical protein